MTDDIKPITIDSIPQDWIDGDFGYCDDCDAKILNLTELEQAIDEGSYESLVFEYKIPLPDELKCDQFIDKLVE